MSVAGHGHSHGLVDDSIKRSREGVRTVLVSLAVLGSAAIAQMAILALTGSVALLADMIHNVGDALTAVPLGIAFLMRSSVPRGRRAVRRGGDRDQCLCRGRGGGAAPDPPRAANSSWHPRRRRADRLAGQLRGRRRPHAGGQSPCQSGADRRRAHARADAYVSLAVIASAAAVAIGAPVADPLIGLAITLVILRITWESWRPFAATATATPTVIVTPLILPARPGFAKMEDDHPARRGVQRPMTITLTRHRARRDMGRGRPDGPRGATPSSPTGASG